MADPDSTLDYYINQGILILLTTISFIGIIYMIISMQGPSGIIMIIASVVYLFILFRFVTKKLH